LLAHRGVLHILCFVFLLCFSSSYVLYIASFSRLTMFDCPSNVSLNQRYTIMNYQKLSYYYIYYYSRLISRVNLEFVFSALPWQVMILWNTIFLLIIPRAGKYGRRQILMAETTITKKILKYLRGNHNRISKKNRQHSGRKKKYKRTNNDLQNIYT
jgi:uncharacterized membrane protein